MEAADWLEEESVELLRHCSLSEAGKTYELHFRVETSSTGLIQHLCFTFYYLENNLTSDTFFV